MVVTRGSLSDVINLRSHPVAGRSVSPWKSHSCYEGMSRVDNYWALIPAAINCHLTRANPISNWVINPAAGPRSGRLVLLDSVVNHVRLVDDWNKMGRRAAERGIEVRVESRERVSIRRRKVVPR